MEQTSTSVDDRQTKRSKISNRKLVNFLNQNFFLEILANFVVCYQNIRPAKVTSRRSPAVATRFSARYLPQAKCRASNSEWTPNLASAGHKPFLKIYRKSVFKKFPYKKQIHGAVWVVGEQIFVGRTNGGKTRVINSPVGPTQIELGFLEHLGRVQPRPLQQLIDPLAQHLIVS